MAQKIKIVIVGIGGVGGYFGGLLAKKYSGSAEVEIVFLARGEHMRQIKASGLKVIKGDTEFTAHPSLATDNAHEAGIADLIIFCTKTFGLEAAVAQLQPCIGAHTMLLPLLNGVDSTEKIKTMLPGANVLEGCVYLVAQIKEPGVVENSGNIQTLHFGINGLTNDRLQLFEKIFKDAGIEATLSERISTVVWEKFIFISPTATATSYFDSRIGKLVAEQSETAKQLIEEVECIARAKGIEVDRDIASKAFTKLKSMPYEATSSMHRDYQNHSPHTEVEALTGYVVDQGQKLNIDTPTYNRMYEGLMKRG